MNLKLRTFSELLSTTIGLTLLSSVALQSWAQNQASTEKADIPRAKVGVVLPSSATTFPAGDGADIANSHCLICHSAGMVLLQPALSESQWQTIINKMRTAYGAPLPADQINALAAYLSKIVSEQDAPASATTK